ncbi:MAG: Rieske 2Fe-2S domain-containing protein [Solirubrobacteraceae bacterium]
MTDRMTPPRAHAAVQALADVEALDAPAKKLGKTVRDLIGPGKLKDALSGSWLGHALHPMLTDLPIGTYTSALLLDWLGGRDSQAAADRLIGLGLLSTAPTVVTGYSEWADSEVGDAEVRRIGIVHAAANVTTASLMAASWVARKRGARGRGRLLALAGGATMGAGAYLGGHLSLAEGIGVDRSTFETAHEDWADALAEGELGEGQMRCVDVAGTPVLVARASGELHAVSNRCVHRGGPLHEGELDGTTVTCPWHSSVFDLRDGGLVHGPAAYPQPAWETRVQGGRIEVRRL